MTQVRPGTRSTEHLDEKEAFSILSEHVNQSCCLKTSTLNGLKIRNQSKANCYSYQIIYVTKTTKENWEVNFTEGTDSTSDISPIEKNKDYGVKPKEYFKDEIINFIVPNSGVYYKCEMCNGVGTVPQLMQKCSCGNQQNVDSKSNPANFTCSKCNKLQDMTVQRCVCKNGQIRKILKIHIEFKNKFFNYFYNPFQIPDNYFNNTKGRQIYNEENTEGRVNALANFEIPEIVEQSKKAIGLHEDTIAQKHFILSYPVWKCDYTMKEENFFLIGNELNVYAPSIPSRSCSIV
ncbi:SSUH2 -like protein [Brachionus plicatilis]|uniref:SSUH2-like protein n=1 Tax=Brachionus plicatilis TaxID=10195 RepID=A0A3M7PYL7_BRAPC|nr:SSUH2 -like protein [Brachionus plicatilis]